MDFPNRVVERRAANGRAQSIETIPTLAVCRGKRTVAGQPSLRTICHPVRSSVCPQHSRPQARGRTAKQFFPAGYMTQVRRAVEYIRAGDVFQVNLSQRLFVPGSRRFRIAVYRLRQRNPAPFAGFFDGGEFQIASASPGTIHSLRRGSHVETRPIKGTRQRTARPEADLLCGVLNCAAARRNRAENVMTWT